MASAHFRNDTIGEGAGIIFSAIEQSGVGGAEEGGSGARGVEPVPGGEVIFFSLLATAFGPNGRTGIDKIFEGAIGADDGADIATLHDEGGGEAEFALQIDEVFAQLGQGGDDRDSRVDLGEASVGGEVAFGFA